MNEFHIASVAGGARRYVIIYHCFFCGGAAPVSKRATFFAEVTSEERARLRSIVSVFKTLEEAIATLGPAAEEHLAVTDAETRNRTLLYTNLSTTADVQLVEAGPPVRLSMRLFGKSLVKRSP